MSTFRILYPESRVVSAEWVLSQGFDAKVNAAVDQHVRDHGVFSDEAGDEAYTAFVASIPAPDLEESIELLEDLGLVTFSRPDGDGDGFDEDDDRDEDRGRYEGGYRVYRGGSYREDFRSDC